MLFGFTIVALEDGVKQKQCKTYYFSPNGVICYAPLYLMTRIGYMESELRLIYHTQL